MEAHADPRLDTPSGRPKRLTPSQVRQVMDMLDNHFDAEKKKYAPGWTDIRVAEDLKLISPTPVRNIRIKEFGAIYHQGKSFKDGNKTSGRASRADLGALEESVNEQIEDARKALAQQITGLGTEQLRLARLLDNQAARLDKLENQIRNLTKPGSAG